MTIPNLGVVINREGGTASVDGTRKALAEAAARGVRHAMLSVKRGLHGGEKGITWQLPEMVGGDIVRCFQDWLVAAPNRTLTLYAGNVVGFAPEARLKRLGWWDFQQWKDWDFRDVVIDWMGGVKPITAKQVQEMGLSPEYVGRNRRGMASAMIQSAAAIGVRMSVEPCAVDERAELALWRYWADEGEPHRPATLDLWARSSDGVTPTMVAAASPRVRRVWINAGERELWDGLTAGVA